VKHKTEEKVFLYKVYLCTGCRPVKSEPLTTFSQHDFLQNTKYNSTKLPYFDT